MSITTELREFVDGLACHKVTHDLLREIADRIDQEHEEEVFDLLREHEEWVHDRYANYVQLPKGADGETIHIGELVDEMLPFGGYAAPAPVDTMELSRGASGYGWMVKLDAENRASISPKLLRHHHEPTVEDVTCEFLQDLSDWLGLKLDIDYIKADDLFAEYAAKLRLAGDVE